MFSPKIAPMTDLPMIPCSIAVSRTRHYNESGILEFLKLAEQHLRFVAEALISGHSDP